MRINGINVSGEMSFNSSFTSKNVLLGENNSGKTTFIKLLLYALGVNINNFIDEIAKENKCNAVSIQIETKSKNAYFISRKLPYADLVNVFPVIDGIVRTEDVQVFNLDEYSDFLLEEELYPKEIISYGQNKTASLRYYFLLRSVVVDQTTPHARILSNLSGEKNDYIASQPLINSAIIEKVLSRNTAEAQRLKLLLKAKEKERNQMSARIAFLDEAISTKLEENTDFPRTETKIRQALAELATESSNLSSEKIDVISNLAQINDNDAEKEIIFLTKTLNDERLSFSEILLNIQDVESTKAKLDDEISIIRNRIAAKKVINSIPVTICPVCLSNLEEDLSCEKCKTISAEQRIDNLSSYKKLIDDSIKEAQSLLVQYYKDRDSIAQNISNLENQLSQKKQAFFNRIEGLRTPLQELIDELKDKIQKIEKEKLSLSSLLNYLVEKEKYKTNRKSINSEIAELQSELEKAETKSMDDEKVINKWLERYNSFYNFIFGSEGTEITLDNNYMPSVNDTEVVKISSESVKLVAQLAYILSLATVNDDLDTQHINDLGFVIFDSPKDKDLDIDKYKRFMQVLNELTNTQIFLTGSVLDEAAYKEAIPNAFYLPVITENDRLLK